MLCPGVVHFSKFLNFSVEDVNFKDVRQNTFTTVLQDVVSAKHKKSVVVKFCRASIGGEFLKGLIAASIKQCQLGPLSTLLSSVLQKALSFVISTKEEQALSKIEGDMVLGCIYTKNLALCPPRNSWRNELFFLKIRNYFHNP